MGLTSSARAATITKWDFENPPDSIAINNNPAPTIGAGTASSLGMDNQPTPNPGTTTDDVLDGVAGDTGTNGVANTSQIWRVRAQADTRGASNGWTSTAPIATQGAVFAASTAGYTGINVSFDWYSTNQGEAKMELQYTTDGSTWINTPINVGTNTPISVLTNATSPNTVMGSYVWGSPTGQGQNWYTNLSAAITNSAASNDPNFAIRMVNASTGADDVSMKNTALNNNSGNWRFDNVSISGTAVPEPSSVALVAVAAVVGLAFMGRCRV